VPCGSFGRADGQFLGVLAEDSFNRFGFRDVALGVAVPWALM